jgi:hypothetical protein
VLKSDSTRPEAWLANAMENRLVMSEHEILHIAARLLERLAQEE